MGTAHVTHTYNVAEVRRLLTSPQGGVVKDLIRRGILVESAAKKNLQRSPTRVNTGRLRSSINWRVVQYRGHPAVRIGTSVSYAIYVHEGTGIYGPKHKLIRPVNKRVLRWKTKGGGYRKKGGKQGAWTYSMSSRGMRPNQFLKDALPAARG